MSNVRFYGQGNPVMEAAFSAFVKSSWRHKETREAFEKDTGMKMVRSPIDAMIDEATGYDEVVAEAFVRWVIENVWGKDD